MAKVFEVRLLSPEFKAAAWKATRKYVIISGVVGLLVGGIIIGAVLPIGTSTPGLKNPLSATPGKAILSGSQMVIPR